MKYGYSLILSLLFAAPSYGANLSLVVTPEGSVFNIETADNERIALYERFQDMWLISDAPAPMTTDIPEAFFSELGIVNFTPLDVPNGSGLLVRFQNEGAQNSLWTWNGNTIDSIDTPVASLSSYVILQDGVILSNALEDDIFMPSNPETGEILPTIPLGTLQPTLSPQTLGVVTAIPTRTGIAFTPSTGGTIQLNNLVAGPQLSVIMPESAPSLTAIPTPQAQSTTSELADLLTEAVSGTAGPSLLSQTRPAEFQDAMTGVAEAINRVNNVTLPERRTLSDLLKDMGALKEDIQQENLAQPEEDVTAPPASDPFFNAQFKLPEGSGLFPRQEVANVLAINNARKELMELFLNASSELDRDKLRIEMARMNINYDRLIEALDIMESTPKFEENGHPKSELTRIMLGALLALADRTEAAEELLSIPGEPNDERELWLAFTLEQARDYPSATKLFADTMDLSLGYPTNLQKILRLSYARALLAQEQASLMQEQIDTLVSVLGKNEKMPPEAGLLLAKAALLRNNLNQAEELLAEVANNETDKESAINAQYEYLMMLYGRGDIDREQTIAALKELRFMWRGGDVEEAVLYKLGRMLVAAEHYREGLDQMKSFNIFFPQSPYREEITALMTETFEGLLTNSTMQHDLDTIAVLGLYYDFRELTPPGEQGDALIIHVADKLKSIGLYERAIALLENQYEFRAQDDKARQAKLALTIAENYLGEGIYPPAKAILAETDSYPMDADLVYKRTLTKAKLAFAERKYNEAIAHLEPYKEREEAEMVLADVAWESENFARFMEFVEPQFVNSSPFASWTPEDRVNFKRLAYIYNQNGQIRNLEGLRNKYINKLVNPYDQRYFEILLKDKGSVIKPMEKTEEDTSILDTVITQMDEYNEFAREYNLIKRARDSEKRQRYLYNQSRGQLTAPPQL